MFEGAVAGLLNRVLGKYVQDLDTENLNVGIFSGDVNLTDLKLKPEALYELDLPIDVKIGTIGKISFKIPWSGLYTQPVVINIEDVLILVGPAISNTHFDPEREKRLTRAAKRKILQDLEAESQIFSGPENFFEQLFTAVVNNIQIHVRNVHVRYEDSISSKDGPLACGLCLQSLSIETTNSKWKPSITSATASTVYAMMRVDSVSTYWNPVSTVLEDSETAHITPMQYYNWKHYMLTGLDKFSMHREEFQFLLKPVSSKVKVIINRSGDVRVPRLLFDAVVQDSAVQLSRDQYLSIDNLLSSFKRISLNRKYRHLHPGESVSTNCRKWWRYAYQVVLEQRVRPYTWNAIRRHRQNYDRYKQTYKSVLRSPNDTELKLDLQKCEDSLPIMSVVIAREHAKFELLSQEPERIEIVEKEHEWWKPSSSNEGSDTEEHGVARSKIDLCVKTERRRSLWLHLSSPERRKLAEFIGVQHSLTDEEKPKQFIEHKLNLTLANCSISLLNRGKEVTMVTLTHFLASIETRPSAKAYKISARAENIIIEGQNTENELQPLLTVEKSTSLNTATNSLAIDFEKNPLNNEADYGICCLMEPVEFLYDEHAITELIVFFQTSPMSAEDFSLECSKIIDNANGVAKSIVKYAVNRKKLFSINFDLKGPTVVIPEKKVGKKCPQVMVVDISRLLIKSDLQPPNVSLEDATCMELEEKLYDRLHAECSCQILFCESSAPWRECRKQPDSELHLVPKTKIQVVFSNSIMKDYKLLPRYKLNISITSLKLNLSDRTIASLLEYIDNVPRPAPIEAYTADSQDLRERVGGELFSKDSVQPDPGYCELVKLRHLIVRGYLRRNRVQEPKFDKDSAKLGFLEGDKSFISSEHSDEDMELYARSVDLPGFDDNVSASNTIDTLLRFIVGEIVINLSRSRVQSSRPYISLNICGVCLDVALLVYGPALQFSVESASLVDKLHNTSTGQHLDIITTGHGEGILLNVLYRKVRCDCPEFRSSFHAVEQSLVCDGGDVTLQLHADGLRTMYKYLQYITDKIPPRHVARLKWWWSEGVQRALQRVVSKEGDPPVPPGATKFSYSFRGSSLKARLCHLDNAVCEIWARGLESECVFRANDRCRASLYLRTLHVTHPHHNSLYSSLVWPDEEKVVEVRYVRAAPRFYGGPGGLQANGEVRVQLGRMHVVLVFSVLHNLQQFIEPLIPASYICHCAQYVERRVEHYAEKLRSWDAKINLVIDIHAPVLLLPQKLSSPNLLVLNMGDLTIENFFKQQKCDQSSSTPAVIDNILVKLANVTLSRAVMTLTGTLEVQEPIIEPVSIRSDIKRSVCYQQTYSVSRQALLVDATVIMEPLTVNIGQNDLATIMAVWGENYADRQYIGSLIPSSPTASPPVDISVKKLQEFFAQGEPVRKEIVVRFVVEGVKVQLFTDMEEMLSSPVRDISNGLARLTAGEILLTLDYYSDATTELKGSLQSLLVEDIRPGLHTGPTKILSSRMGQSPSEGVVVSGAAVAEGSWRRAGGGAHLDLRVDSVRLCLLTPFFIALLRTVLDAMPAHGVERVEGVVNHGYVSEGGRGGAAPRPGSCSDSTSGYYSAATLVPEDTPSLSVSIQLRQPEIMFYSEHSKNGHALLLRTELLIDYSSHSNTENLVVSLAGLQVISRLQSKLRSIPPQVVLRPCDVEFSRNCKNTEDGVKVALSVSDLDVHLAATTVHTVMDIIDEVQCELSLPEEKEQFNFAAHSSKCDKYEDELWSPKKLTQYMLAPNDDYVPTYNSSKLNELFTLSVPCVKVTFELETKVRLPVIFVKMSMDLSILEWSRDCNGTGRLQLEADYYNNRKDVWEPLLEHVLKDDHVFTTWHLNTTIFQSKAYSTSSRIDTTTYIETEPAEAQKKTRKRKSGFESETSADEADSDTEMVLIKSHRARENQPYTGDNKAFRSLDGFESDSEKENGLMDKLSEAIGHLFTDESSSDESENEDTSAAEQSEGDFIDQAQEKDENKEKDVKTVTLQEPTREDSVDSGLEAENFIDKMCTYVVIESSLPLNVSVTPQLVTAVCELITAYCDREETLTRCMLTGDDEFVLCNDIGPGSTVHLISRSETDLAGNDRVICVADYDQDHSRPSTPGLDNSADGILDGGVHESRNEVAEDDDWDCMSSILAATPSAPPPECTRPTASQLYSAVTQHRLSIKMHDFDDLTVLCPQRTCHKVHVLHPSRNSTRYYVVVEKNNKFEQNKIVVRSPLQIRNETSYALEVYYKKTDLAALGVDLIGEPLNPFDDKMRVCILPPDDTYNVPLYIAYHCHLFFLPLNFESYQTATEGIWWMDLASDLGTPRDVICPAKLPHDNTTFAMRILTVQGAQSPKITRAIPNYLIRVLPPLAIHNRLQFAVDVSLPCLPQKVRIEAGERTHIYTCNLTKSQRMTVEMHYMGLAWTGSFNLTPDVAEKSISMSHECEWDGAARQLSVSVKVDRHGSWELYVYSPYWIINKTGLPLQIKGVGSDYVLEVREEGALWSGAGGGRGVRVCCLGGGWSRRAPLSAPGLLVCTHHERRNHYRMMLTVSLSELSPQLTKIVTILPYFIVYNDTKKHLRFMEENEAADLWIDLAPQQCTAFWPQTNSMCMHCKFRDSNTVSAHFPVNKCHFTVLRMDKGSALSVSVTGGTTSPFSVTFRPYCVGDSPVRIDNLCDDLFLKLHQEDSGQVALLSPYQSMLYTWDDPVRDRVLIWNVYNNKGKGYVADYTQDGYGEVKVSFHSVKHSPLIAANSVTSKLSSTFKILTPKSPEPSTSSSEDSDTDFVHVKAKKTRKDKVIVYWSSYMDNHQRVFTLVQDERIAYQYRSKISNERSNFEVYFSLKSVNLSLCVGSGNDIKELALICMTDSLPRWEVNVSHKWKQLSPDLASWIEDKYQSDVQKCELKNYLHLDLEKMQMTKPFFAELRRTYSPGIWTQIRKSDTFTYVNFKLNRLQIDNQLSDAVFPCVLHPQNQSIKNYKPSIELVSLKQYRQNLNQDLYKYLKVLIQEHSVNLDRGFVNYIFDILNRWRVEEKPSERLRADLALVHMPLPVIAMKNQLGSNKSVVFEYVHISPLKFNLSLSSRGCTVESGNYLKRSKFGKKEQRPKLFNSDLLEFLFHSWGATLCDMKDVVFRMSFMELRNTPTSLSGLMEATTKHYWFQLVQQFYVLILGVNVLGNPHSDIGDFTRPHDRYYEPSLGITLFRNEISSKLSYGVSAALGHCASGALRPATVFGEAPPPNMKGADRKLPDMESRVVDIPRCLLEASRTHPTSIALAISGLIATHTFDIFRSASCVSGSETGLRMFIERVNVPARQRLPRHCSNAEALSPYEVHSSLGVQLLCVVGRGHYADTDCYIAHAQIPPAGNYTMLVTTQHIIMVCSVGGKSWWHTEWTIRLDDLIGVPNIEGNKLIIHIKEDERINYFEADEKVIEVPDAEVLVWLQSKIECALILAMEDKRCPKQL